MCGENRLRCERAATSPGSPPRVRGKLQEKEKNHRRSRITPACAGKTTQRSNLSADGRDHPRVCGENCLGLRVAVALVGSPPRVRGKQVAEAGDAEAIRITPACAGKTRWGATPWLYWADHPRVCGENSQYRQPRLPVIGSPPRVRGKHFGNGVFPWLILVLSLDLL